MPKSKKPRRTITAGQKARQAARTAATKDREREHYTREFARLNSPHSQAAIDSLIGPMEEAVFAIEATGDGLVDREGDYVFFPTGLDECFSLPEGLFALCKALAVVSSDLRQSGIARVAHKLQAHMPLFPSDMDGARAGFGWAREELAKLTPTEFLRLTDEAEA